MKVIKITFDCDKEINNDVINIKIIEDVSKNRVLNVLLKFAIDCYVLAKDNKIEIDKCFEIFKKGVDSYVNNKGRNHY